MSKVKIQGNASGTGVLTVTAPNTSTDRTITLPDEDVTLGAATPSIDDNGDATAITIDSSENVGIGKTDPTAKLEISVTDTDSSPVNGTNIYKARSSHSLQISNVSDSATYSGIHLRTRSTGASAWSINNVHTSQYVGDLTFVTRTDTSSASERMRILASGGLTFNGDTAAGNALDDYEEGSGTSSQIAVKLGSTALTVSGAGYKYTKIGNIVHFQFEFRITNLNGASSGTFSVGLPFTTITNGYSAGALRIYDGAVDGNEFIGADSNSNVLYLARRVNNSGTANVTATNNAYYFGQITYITS